MTKRFSVFGFRFSVLAVLCALPLPVRADEAKLPAGVPNVFADGLADAQKKCVKLLGAGAGNEVGYATGLIVSPDGLILTAQGIYLAGQRIRVVLPDGSIHEAHEVRRSEKLQAALLKIGVRDQRTGAIHWDGHTPDYFELPVEPNVQKGDWVLAVSNLFKVADGDEPLSVSLGVMSLRTAADVRHRTQDVPYEGEMLLVSTITSNPGAPGGALIGDDGRLVGMIGKLLMSTATNTRLNYAIPADLLRPFVQGEDVDAPSVDEQESGQPELGIRLFTLGGRRGPAYVDRIIPGSPAAEAGLRRDDLIMSINGETVRDVSDYNQIFEQLRPGREATVLVKRGNDVLPIKITPVKAD